MAAQVAFIEVHRRGRIVVRGTIAGRYVDIEDEGDLIGRDTAYGAILGAAVGLPLGPPGWAVGLVAGGAVGGLHETSHIPTLQGPGFDEIRKDVPEKSSALLWSPTRAMSTRWSRHSPTRQGGYALPPVARGIRGARGRGGELAARRALGAFPSISPR